MDDFSKSFTESAVRRFYQYFIINTLYVVISYMSILLAAASLPFISSYSFNSFATGYAIGVVFLTIYFLFAVLSIWIVVSGNLKIYLLVIVLFCYALSFILPIFAVVIAIIIFLIVLFILIWGVFEFFIGRNEFSKKHKIFVTVAFSLAIIYFILFLINIALFGINANLLFSFYLYYETTAFLGIFLTSIIITIVLTIISNLIFVLFIYNLSKKKAYLLIAFVLGILGPATFSITGIVSLILFFICYREAHGDLNVEAIKPILKVPCPFCNREIPEESTQCPHCKTIFRKRNLELEDEDF